MTGSGSITSTESIVDGPSCVPGEIVGTVSDLTASISPVSEVSTRWGSSGS